MLVRVAATRPFYLRQRTRQQRVPANAARRSGTTPVLSTPMHNHRNLAPGNFYVLHALPAYEPQYESLLLFFDVTELHNACEDWVLYVDPLGLYAVRNRREIRAKDFLAHTPSITFSRDVRGSLRSHEAVLHVQSTAQYTSTPPSE